MESNYDRPARIRGRLVCSDGVRNLVHLGQPIMGEKLLQFLPICEHLTFVLDARGQGRPVVLQCAYCPLCGKNLTCLHYGIDGGGTDYYGTSNPAQEADWNFKHCPSCGEQL